MTVDAKELGGTFVCFPRHVFHVDGMSLQRLKVYEAIFQFWHRGKTVYLSNANLMERCGISDKGNLNRTLDWLEEKNLIERFWKGKKRYIRQPLAEIEVEEEKTVVTHDYHGSHTGLPSVVTHDYPTINIISRSTEVRSLVDSTNTTIEKNPVNDKRKKPKSYLQDERFLRFYRVYPKKEKPQDAYKAFLSLNPDDALLDKIVNDVLARKDRHTQWQNMQYIPLPATYLRSAAYDGEIYNEADEKAKKALENAELSRERIAAQERVSRAVSENHANKEADAMAFRNIARNIDEGVRRIPEGLKMLKKELGMLPRNT